MKERWYRIKSEGFAPKEHGIPGKIFYTDMCGFNQFVLCRCPIEKLPQSRWQKYSTDERYRWVYSSFTIHHSRIEQFLSQCEFIGESITEALSSPERTINKHGQWSLF